MATRKPANKAASTPPVPAIIAIPEVNKKALGKIVSFAEMNKRRYDATKDTERALSALVREADQIATLAGDVHADHGTTIERERHARKIDRLTATLGKVRADIAELAAV